MRRPYYGWVLVVTLGVTETISWGVLFYAFTVFVTPMQAELGWSRAAIAGAFSVALLVSGVAAYPVGRWLDARGPRALMTFGSCAGVLCVLAWSAVRNLAVYYAIWVGIGLAMAAALYNPAFQVIAVWFVRRRAAALTALTLMAGWASVIFIPLSGRLVQAQGWRPALVTLAAILGAGTILPHAFLLRRRPEDLGLAPDGAAPATLPSPGVHVPLRQAVREATFWWLVGAFCLMALADAALAVHLVPYLTSRGYDAGFASAAAGLLGAASLGGRLLFAPAGARLPGHVVTAGNFALATLALVVLVAAPGTIAVLAFALLFGAARGANTLARASVVAERYGRRFYGSISGVLTFCVVLAQAAAPVSAGAAYDALGRYEPVWWTLAGLTLAAALIVSLTGDRSPPQKPLIAGANPAAPAPP